MTIKPFTIPAVEIAGRAKETLALDNSRPGVDGNTVAPPLPATGEVPFFSPTDAANPIPEEFNTGGKVPKSPTVIADDGEQRVI